MMRPHDISNPIKHLVYKCLHAFIQTPIATFIKIHGRLVAVIYDVCAIVLAWTFASWFVTHLTSNKMLSSAMLLAIWIVPGQWLFLKYMDLYRGFWRFASIQDLKKIIFTLLISGNLIGLFLYLQTEFVSLQKQSFYLASLYSLSLILLLSFGRISVRLAKEYSHQYDDCRTVLIVGAGNAGESLARNLLRDHHIHYKLIAFVDNDLKKSRRTIHGIPVLGTTQDLPKLVKKYHIHLVFIAIPSIAAANMKQIYHLAEMAQVHCYTLPSLKDLSSGHVSVDALRHLSIEDLLGRYPVIHTAHTLIPRLCHKTILVTGGGGSIGSELCRQILSLTQQITLIILDNNEYNLYAIETELKKQFSRATLRPILLSVTDHIGIQQLFQTYRPHFVFHAAAYKHVPILENQIRIAINNNIVGTMSLAEESAKAQVETFVLISTDKAVHPTNIMGATKRASEYFCQYMGQQTTHTKFITVRFGNVLNSTGSVIPLFKKQIESGGPVTVTHPEMTRFFMTIPEASQLILQATSMGQGNEIFVLDMGDPVKISYLAEQMIKIAGKIPHQDIKMIYTGLRPGEKLYEECFYENEILQPTEHAKILKTQWSHQPINNALYQQLAALCHQHHIDTHEYLSLLKTLVPEYRAMHTLQMQSSEAIIV